MTDAPVAERILVIGNSCAGKSTFARSLALKIGLPIVELDALYWEPGWQPAAPERFRQRILASTSGEGAARFYGAVGGAPGMNGELRIYPQSGYILVGLSNLDPPAAENMVEFFSARMPVGGT